jgi:hypothetical protein
MVEASMKGHDLWQKAITRRRNSMMKKLTVLAAMLAMMLVMAVPAWADDFDFGEDDLVFGFPSINVVDDVDVENVRERNPKDGECFADDVDLDGFVAEWEITCYV